MTNEELKKVLALLGLLALAGCGVSENAGDTKEGLGSGGLALKIRGASGFDPAIDHARIGKYRVKIEAADMAEPMVAEFEGTAESGIIENVPTGDNRIVSVEAVNLNDKAIKAGEAFGVGIGGGENEVDVTMEAIPIFTNLAKDAVVDNTRLVFRIFSDPSHPVTVEEVAEETSNAVVDAATNSPQIDLDTSTGLGTVAPKPMEPGERKFVVRDVITGRSSEAKITLLDGSLARPAPFAAAASASKNEISVISSVAK